MDKQLTEIKEQAKKDIDKALSVKDIEAVKIEVLGKSGKLTALLKGMKDLPSDKRPIIGQLVNTTREFIENELSKKTNQLAQEELNKQLEEEKVDVTMPGIKASRGSLHPLNIVKKQIIETFMGMGFSLADGPEIETEHNAFEALNIPSDHPARDMQDTFYIIENIVLRPHTSPAQIRTMKTTEGAIKILSPGRVYRADDDATHSPMFHQIEGLVVDKKATLCDLKGLLDEFAKRMFSRDTKTRFRPSYFPFTEPSVEVDMSCKMCGGMGCRLCKGTGWIEILGAGVINQRVLENCNIDTNVYSGLAFGLGLERIAMIKYGINDIRLLFENDLRLLKQF